MPSEGIPRVTDLSGSHSEDLAPRRDASGALVALRARPTRIVSLIPSITELLFALGLDDRIVGVTVFCTEPRDRVARTAKVGREKDPDLSRIHALAPDLVVANMEENRRDVVEALRAAGVPVWVTFPRTVVEGIGLIRELGALTGAEAAAAAIAGPHRSRACDRSWPVPRGGREPGSSVRSGAART